MTDKVFQLVVIGGGPAGIMAAGTAARYGAKVCLLEKMPGSALKLGLTGKGRCNLTNADQIPDFIAHFGPNGRFLRQTFNHFFNTELIQFFEELQIPLVKERGGRYFPATERAPAIAAALRKWLKQSGVKIHLNHPVKAIQLNAHNYFEIHITDHVPEPIVKAQGVILTTGGASYPATGSSGDGYLFARSFGHSIIPIRPALVPLETIPPPPDYMQGLNLKNVNMSVWIDTHKKMQYFGEMTFTPFGVSGPIVLAASKKVVDALRNEQQVELRINLKPALSNTKLDLRLIREFTQHSEFTLENILQHLMPKQLIPFCSEQIRLDGQKLANQISSLERKKLRIWLQDIRFQISDFRSFNESIITAGGINLREINPRTMESRLVKNLFFAGELLDLDADTGGYNLQAAFSTGWLAGYSAALNLNQNR
jgi:predicted Rossmann fold flavoprotein